VEISAAASLEVAEHCVDPALLRQIVGVLSSGDDGLVLELAVATARKQASRSERPDFRGHDVSWPSERSHQS
jgi:hypothetical protein